MKAEGKGEKEMTQCAEYTLRTGKRCRNVAVEGLIRCPHHNRGYRLASAEREVRELRERTKADKIIIASLVREVGRHRKNAAVLEARNQALAGEMLADLAADLFSAAAPPGGDDLFSPGPDVGALLVGVLRGKAGVVLLDGRGHVPQVADGGLEALVGLLDEGRAPRVLPARVLDEAPRGPGKGPSGWEFAVLPPTQAPLRAEGVKVGLL